MRSYHLQPTWIDLEGLMLSEISQMENDKYYMISLEQGILKTKHNKMKNQKGKEIRLVVPCGNGWEKGQLEEGGQRYKF